MNRQQIVDFIEECPFKLQENFAIALHDKIIKDIKDEIYHQIMINKELHDDLGYRFGQSLFRLPALQQIY